MINSDLFIVLVAILGSASLVYYKHSFYVNSDKITFFDMFITLITFLLIGVSVWTLTKANNAPTSYVCEKSEKIYLIKADLALLDAYGSKSTQVTPFKIINNKEPFTVRNKDYALSFIIVGDFTFPDQFDYCSVVKQIYGPIFVEKQITIEDFVNKLIIKGVSRKIGSVD